MIWNVDMSLMLACFEMLALIKFIEIDNAWLQRHIYRFFWITLELIYNQSSVKQQSDFVLMLVHKYCIIDQISDIYFMI